jgi:hypothetical protein
MPNWVSYNVTATGEPKEIAILKKNGFNFEKVDPTPKELTKDIIIQSIAHDEKEAILDLKRITDERKEKYGHVGWYSWRLEHWGTKWDIANRDEMVVTKIHKNKSVLSTSFDTAWSLAVPGLLKISKMVPNTEIEMEVEEEAGFFKGTMKIKNGEIYEEAINEGKEQ